MIKLFTTTDKEQALDFEREAEQICGTMAIYRFQYQSNDGKFYYEILLNPNWL